MDNHLREKLLAMVCEDERVREELAETGELFDGYNSKMEKAHLNNARELDDLINEYGWLGKDLVGEDGAEAEWRIAMHAISLPDFQRKCLNLLREAVQQKQGEPYHFAYLQDRISFLEGSPQRFGTQSDWNADGEMEVWTLEDEEKVNDFRAEVGLESLESKIQNCDERESKPKDWQKRQRDFIEWTKKVGWRK